MRSQVVLLTLVLALACGACSLLGEDAETGVFEGFYALGFEDSTFEPCARDERWWVAPVDEETARELNERYLEAYEQGGVRVFVRLRGVRSRKGSYGHLGSYERQLTVSQVLDVRAARPGDCR